MATNSNTRFVLGIKFQSTFDLSEVILRGQEQKPIKPDHIYLQDMLVSYEDTGELDIQVTPLGRASGSIQKARNSKGQNLGGIVGGNALVESSVSRYNTRGLAKGMYIRIQSDSHLPMRISTITNRGNSVVRRRPV